MRYLLLLLFVLCGCWESRSTTDTQTEKHDTWTANGSLPQVNPTTGAPVMVPFNLTVERFGNEAKAEKSETKAGLDEEKLKSLIAASMQAGFSTLTGFSIPQSKPWNGFTPTETGASGMALTAAALYIKEMLAKRREQQELLEVKQARSEAQAQALELAKQIDPNKAKV